MRSRPFSTLLAFGAALVLTLTARGSLFAGMSPTEQARRDVVVAHVGPTTISVGELEDRIALVPRFQLKAFGDTPDVIRRRFFEQVIEPEVLYSLAAAKLHLADRLPTSNKVLRTESGATSKALIHGVPLASTIPMTEVQRYYDANRLKYDTPPRIYLFRILCTTREQAAEVLASAKKEPTLEVFSKLAHDVSIDKATAMRAGNLGYLNPDGTSSEAGLKVDPAIVKAAERVKDGEFVAEPVPEKTGPSSTAFAVVWRRGTVPANRRTVEAAAMQIRETLWKEQADMLTRQHLQELRVAHLTELNESLLNGIDITASEGDVVTRRRPGEVAPLTPGGRNAPHAN